MRGQEPAVATPCENLLFSKHFSGLIEAINKIVNVPLDIIAIESIPVVIIADRGLSRKTCILAWNHKGWWDLKMKDRSSKFSFCQCSGCTEGAVFTVVGLTKLDLRSRSSSLVSSNCFQLTVFLELSERWILTAFYDSHKLNSFFHLLLLGQSCETAFWHFFHGQVLPEVSLPRECRKLDAFIT